MSLTSSMRTRYLAWSQSTPLPILPDAPPTFQAWHTFDESRGSWTRLHTPPPTQPHERNIANQVDEPTLQQPPTLDLATWNVDAFGKDHEARMEGILSTLRSLTHQPDVIFFQEVSPKALNYILNNTWVREGWILSDADETNWARVQFATLTLLSRSRFNKSLGPGTSAPYSGPCCAGLVWRVKFSSRFKRDALCCDVFHHDSRIRLVNVHLDSLPIQPSQRPRQVEIAASLLAHAGVACGLVAGDFNPVSPEDAAVISKNGLVDAWEVTHPGEDGFTWGLDGSGAPFPPGRFDRVAVLGLRPEQIEVVPAGLVSDLAVLDERLARQGEDEQGPVVRDDPISWSDHSGLLVSFGLI
ncbi:hypothetical protein diail_12070 [Diaporthe ilicicola]|nr:hypothetical protein diail_12070 [Diaporthe ilicicola]